MQKRLRYILPLLVMGYALAMYYSYAHAQLAVGQGYGAAANGGGAAATASPAATPTPLAQQQINDGANFALRMNDAAVCSTIVDRSAGAHNATVHGGVTCGNAGGGVDGATAATFNGSTGYLTAAAPTQAYPFTIEMAILSTTVNTGGLWDMNPGVGGTRDVNCGVGTVNTANVAQIGLDSGCFSTATTSSWAFIDVEYSTSLVNVYVNGILGTTSSAAAGTYAQGASIGIGSLNTGGANFFAGSMQDFAIYPTALSQAIIKKHVGAYYGF